LEGTWDEESKLDPRSPYSASKASAELICNSFFVTHNIDVRITRSSNNFGPRQNLEKMVPKIIYSLINNVPIPVYGNGLNVRDWVYVKDNCIGIWKTMLCGKPGQIYNLGGENEISNLELIKSIAELFNIVKPKIQFVEDRKGHDFRYSMSSNKAARQIGYIPSKDFNSGLKETVEYYKNSLK
jgi:dTDP-glucose 4,6-dehydratase